MTDPVDALKKALSIGSDIGLAEHLGLERSTIAQWRRRGSLPARYKFMLDPKYSVDVWTGSRIRFRREVYGDGYGRYLLAAALAFIPSDRLEWPELSSANLGMAREARILNVVIVVLDVCSQTLGKSRCENEEEFLKLMEALKSDEAQAAIAESLQIEAVGEV